MNVQSFIYLLNIFVSENRKENNWTTFSPDKVTTPWSRHARKKYISDPRALLPDDIYIYEQVIVCIKYYT